MSWVDVQLGVRPFVPRRSMTEYEGICIFQMSLGHGHLIPRICDIPKRSGIDSDWNHMVTEAIQTMIVLPSLLLVGGTTSHHFSVSTKASHFHQHLIFGYRSCR
jgi:hypothetical protein